MATAMEDGSHIGQYRILKKIGSGGMGTVFLGEHILLGRRAAIKTLLPLLSTKPEIVERFFREARATSTITDPGVVQVFDFGYAVDGTAYIVMELLEGEALSARLDRLGRLPAAEALRITRQLAGALVAAHAHGIVHRDLKPENVFLIKDAEAQGGERAKLLDFGICKQDGDETHTQSGVMLGTPVYMSPEQCQGLRTIDGRSDVYGLGCVLFQILTGRVPFDHQGHGDLIVAHLQHEPPVPSEVAPELSPLVDEIVLRCLAKSPDERFQSMTALQHAIDQVLPQLTPVPASEGPTALALGTGFKSNYDGNFRSRPTRNEKPTPGGWYVTATPVPSDTDEVIARTATRGSLVVIMLAAVVVGLIGISLAQSGDDADPRALAATSVLETIAKVRALEATTAIESVAEVAPPTAMTVEKPQPVPAEVEPPAPDVDKVVEPPAPKPQPVATRRPNKPTQRPTIVRERAPKPPPPPPEDLYDTR